jgi:hypothetical protein
MPAGLFLVFLFQQGLEYPQRGHCSVLRRASSTSLGATKVVNDRLKVASG